MKVTRGLFAEAFRNVLYTPDGLAQAPTLVRQLLDGDERGLTETALQGRRSSAVIAWRRASSCR